MIEYIFAITILPDIMKLGFACINYAGIGIHYTYKLYKNSQEYRIQCRSVTPLAISQSYLDL